MERWMLPSAPDERSSLGDPPCDLLTLRRWTSGACTPTRTQVRFRVAVENPGITPRMREAQVDGGRLYTGAHQLFFRHLANVP